MLAHGQRRFRQAHILGAHDLVGLGVLQHPVLVDACLMREGVLADDRLVVLDGEARDARDQAACLHDPCRIDAGRIGHDVVAHAHGHDDFFQRGVARALAQPVDRALDLAGACGDGCQRIGGRHAQIVMAVGRDRDRVDARHALFQHADDIGALTGGRVAHCVGDIDRASPCLDGGLDRGHQEIPVGAGGVLGAPLHIDAHGFGVGDRGLDLLEHLVPRHLQLVFHVQIRGRDEGVDARLLGVFDGAVGPVDIAQRRARQPADHRILDDLGDLGHRFEITLRGNGEARLDNVDAHLVQQARDLQLFGQGHGGAGGLFPIAHGGVEDLYAILIGHGFGLVCHRSIPFDLCLLQGSGRRVSGTPPRAAPQNPAPSEADKKKEPAKWQGEGLLSRQGSDVRARLHRDKYTRPLVNEKQQSQRPATILTNRVRRGMSGSFGKAEETDV